MKTVAIIQARMGSTRLPGKVMRLVNGRPLIELLLLRLSQATEVDEIVLAIPVGSIDDDLASFVTDMGYKCFRGSELDVLDRYIKAGRGSFADIGVRITGDCPLIDPGLVDKCIRMFKESKNLDYMSNCVPPSYPDGLDVEVFAFKALERANIETVSKFDREHVTPYLRDSGKFSTGVISHTKDLSYMRWTVDEMSDFEVVSNVFEALAPDVHFSWLDVLKLQATSPELFFGNQDTIRNEGSAMGTGQKLYKRAKNVIPGGNMLLSKRPEMYLPDQWPSYYSKSKGCSVWDLDGVEYIDMSIMGIGTNILGYGNDDVDEAVRETVNNGNMSTLNCPEEVFLAEKLVELHPWADMVRFARSGGEANAIAIRIARAATGKEKVAICGYHGWHDWYLSANLQSEQNLDGHLLSGLSTAGVPTSLAGTVLPFNYNDFSGLEQLVAEHDIGVIKMEVIRNMGPEDNFLHKVRKLASERNIVLIFDECTSGFRETFGGIHKKYGVEPDIAMFGKALGNGYAITAILGRRDVMSCAQNTFISSTFWTERIGPSAALKTLEIMEKTNSWNTITETGLDIRRRWQIMAEKYELSIDNFGIPALTGFSFQGPRALEYKTLLTQEMLGKGYLASNSVYVSVAHTPSVVDGYFEALDPVFELIKSCDDGRDVNSLLKGPICHSGFKRLN